MSTIAAALTSRCLAPWTLWQRVEPLAETLEEVGVPVIPPDLIARHKKAEIHKLRPGLWRLLGPAVRANFDAARLMKDVLGQLVLIGTLLATAGLVHLWRPVTEVGGTALTWIMMIPLCVIITTPTISRIMKLALGEEKYDRITARWVSEGLWLYDSDVPRHLRGRAVVVTTTIPDIAIETEWLQEDPLLCVVRRGRFRTERVYIGAWDTGNPELDDA